MPKFVSGSSGQVYSHRKLDSDEIEDEISKITNQTADQKASNLESSNKKPSAFNKKGAKEQQKSNLDLFKEELRRLNEERDQQQHKLKAQSLPGDNTQTTNDHEKSSQQQKVQLSQICIPLRPDPRCPTTLTLQVNLNLKDKDSISSGSFDTGDPATTNLYLGNLNPSVNENDLCDIFGKFGPLASIKVMWPRTDEERARNRNSGFVAYMSRVDAERAMRTLNGLDIRGYDLKLGWGKAVPLPQNPVFIPPDLVKLLEPPPYTGLPFNAQLHESDLRRKYKVPDPQPKKPLNINNELKSQLEAQKFKESKEEYDEFIEVFNRSKVRVVIPQNRALLDRIHKTIEYVIRDGPVFEAIIIARERNNADYKFLYENRSHEHVYYRWKLYSILNGDDTYKWQTDEFRMFEGGPMWKPPPLNPFADGMPVELIEKSTGVNRDILLDDRSLVLSRKSTDCLDVRSTVRLHLNLNDTRQKGSLGQIKRPQFEEMLHNLKPTKASIGSAMLFCINHSDAAKEVIDCISESSAQKGIALDSKVALVFLISDVLHNCSAAVTNASFYRQGFQEKLVAIFKNLRQYIVEMMTSEQVGKQQSAASSTITTASATSLSHQRCDNFKHKILSVLGAWREWTLYEDEFIIQLSNILLGIGRNLTSQSADAQQQQQHKQLQLQQQACLAEVAAAGLLAELPIELSLPFVSNQEPEDSLDGEQLDEAILIECLEKKGLSLRWYKTLDLSDNEADGAGNQSGLESPIGRRTRDRSTERPKDAAKDGAPVKFKASKWETVDPSEVAEQVVRLSKWEAAAAEHVAAEAEQPILLSPSQQLSATSSASPLLEGDSFASMNEHQLGAKKIKLHESNSSSSSSNSFAH